MIKAFSALKAFSLFVLIVVICGCAGSRTPRQPASLVLVRAGGFSGLEERYTLDESGQAKKTMRFPGEEEKVTFDATLSRPEVQSIFDYIHRNIDSLRALSSEVNTTGNLTTTLILNYGQDSHSMRWPGLEPPVLKSSKLDTLYLLVAPLPRWLSSDR